MATIDIRIQRVGQLFNKLDPSSFHEKALSRDTEDYIIGYAGEHSDVEPLHLVIHGPLSFETHTVEVTCAIHAHFQFAYEHCRRQYRRRMRIGRRLLVVGIAVLVVALLLRALLGTFVSSSMLVAIGEGLLIFGWVAMWRPIEILLFERLENHQNRTLLQRLSQIPITFEYEVVKPEVSVSSGVNPDNGTSS